MRRASPVHQAPGRRSSNDASQIQLAARPGKGTLSEALPPVQASARLPSLQLRSGGPAARSGGEAGGASGGGGDIHAIAARGVEGGGSPLPHLDQIQASFGAKHDASRIQAHVGGAATEAAGAMGAQAYATGNSVAFASQPDLHTAAHEAAHVVQQRAGVQLKGGVGEQGDAHERHADAVADAVVKGESSAALLDQYGGHSTPAPVARQAVQRLVINLDPGDKTINQSAMIHKRRDDEQAEILNKFHGEQRANPDTSIITGELGLDEETPPLHKIAPDESITVLAHGTPAMGRDEPRVAGKTALELFQHLVKMGLTTKHTGIINLSNCTSAWDRKATGSFLDRFVHVMKANGHTNFVTGYESFTESADDDHELEVPHDKREIFLAHKVTERYMMRLMNMRPEDGVKDGGAALKQIHAEIHAGALDAAAEARDFFSKQDEESQKLTTYYLELNGLLMEYLLNTEGKYNEKLAFEATVSLMTLMKKYEFDNMGFRLHGQKTEAIPVLAGGEG